MADITINIEKLTSALTKLDSLISSVDTHRRSAMSNTPIALPSLTDEDLGKTTTWLNEQKPELQTRLDLARLLDVDGDGNATYRVEQGDQLWEVKDALATEMTDQLNGLDINSVEGRRRAALLASLLERYQNDPDISLDVMNGLGPEGLTTVMNKLRNLTNSSAPGYVNLTGDASAEKQALIALQESMGKGLAGMFSTASDHLSAGFGTKVAQNPWAAAVLLRYIDKANRDLNPVVFEAMGVELKTSEHNDPQVWSRFGNADYMFFGDQSLSDLNPLREYLNVADNSTRAAQALMGNEELMSYFLIERPDSDGLSDQAGKVLKTATVDVALSDNDQYAKNAADISSHALYMVGSPNAAPLEGVKEELGQIIGTYIMSVEGSNPEFLGQERPGIDYNPLREPFTAADGFPKYGLNLNPSIVTDVLMDIGDNEEAARTVGQATTMYNQVLFDRAAQAGNDQELLQMADRAAAFTGWMQDGLLDGRVIGANTDIESRKKAAELFTLPLDFIKADKLPVVGPYILGEVKDGITESYAGDNSAVIAESTETWHNYMTTTKMQAYYAMATSGNYDDTEIVQNWPKDGNGEPKSPDQLNRDDINGIIGTVEGNDTDDHKDLAFRLKTNVNNSFDNWDNRVDPQ
jgi:hypothetical protein